MCNKLQMHLKVLQNNFHICNLPKTPVTYIYLEQNSTFNLKDYIKD